MKLNRYSITFFDHGIRTQGSEIVKATTAEDAFFIWEMDQKNSAKRFMKIEALEAEDETGITQG